MKCRSRSITLLVSSLICSATNGAQVLQSAAPSAVSSTAGTLSYAIKISDNGIPLYSVGINDLGVVTGGEPFGAFVYKRPTITEIVASEGTGASGNSINNAGDVVGSAATRAFLYSGGKLSYLDFGQGQDVATGINNSGQITGYVTQDAQHANGVLYQGGAVKVLPAISGQTQMFPIAINSLGEIAGKTGPNGPYTASVNPGFIYTHGYSLPITAPDGQRITVTGFDSSGRVAGYLTPDDGFSTAFVYSNGKFTVIPNANDGMKTVTGQMNECGEFVGRNDFGAFIYTHGAILQLAPFLQKKPDNSLYPIGVNNRGVIFGTVGTPVASILTMTPNALESCGTDATIVNTPSSSTVGPAGEITYSIEAKNLTASTQQFMVTNALGRESRLLSCNVSGSAGTCANAADGRSVAVDLPNLTKGSSAIITVKVRIAGTSGDDQLVMDTATLSSSATADYLSTAYTNIKLTADLSVIANLISDQSGLLHYLATVTDLGPNNSHAALLLDQLPANTTFVSASTTAGTCSFHPTIGPNGAVRCPLGNLAHSVPAKVDVFLRASPAACPSVTNMFSLTGKSIDSNTSNDSSTVVAVLSGSECISGMANR